MFCRNCAEVMLDTDITCPKCGFAAGTGIKYCASCGSETPAGTVVCEICGQPVNSLTGGDMQFQQAPQQAAFQQQTFAQPQQDVQFRQAPQQGGFQQRQSFGQTSFQQVNPNFQQQYGQQGAQQFRSADPNAQGQAGGYIAPNTFQQNANGQFYQGVTYKSKMTAGLLGIFLGVFGVHNFYLGYTGKAVTQLLLTVLSCGALSFVSAIWGIVEGIMLLTGSINQDGKGLPMKE